MIVIQGMPDDIVDGGWSNTDGEAGGEVSDDGGGGTGGHSMKDLPAFLSNYCENGLVINGVILWIDIQDNETASEIWINQAKARYTEDEVSEAKRALWIASGAILGSTPN